MNDEQKARFGKALEDRRKQEKTAERERNEKARRTEGRDRDRTPTKSR